MTVITVSQLNNYIKRYVDANDLLSGVYVKGEISNFKHHSSGHIYMTLKDNQSSLKCVMFSQDVYNLKFVPKDGMKVIAIGRVSVYERDGVYQLYIKELIPDGSGDLYIAFEQLKNELEKLGYFDTDAKKAIPAFPSAVGIVTSKTGAALQDILNISSRRYPMCSIYVYPAQVQGLGAAQTIVKGLEYFNSEIIPDVIIVARGGGSIEDLWAFNERPVADAIFKSCVPVVSAIGHETDYTISDFTADLRAPTPSAAAELVFPDRNELMACLLNFEQRCKKALISNVNNKRFVLERLIAKNPSRILSDRICDELLYLDKLKSNLTKCINLAIERCDTELAKKCASLDALSPIKVLSRGYCVAKNDVKVIKSISDVSKNDPIKVVLSDGSFDAVVTDIS